MYIVKPKVNLTRGVGGGYNYDPWYKSGIVGDPSYVAYSNLYDSSQEIWYYDSDNNKVDLDFVTDKWDSGSPYFSGDIIWNDGELYGANQYIVFRALAGNTNLDPFANIGTFWEIVYVVSKDTYNGGDFSYLARDDIFRIEDATFNEVVKDYDGLAALPKNTYITLGGLGVYTNSADIWGPWDNVTRTFNQLDLTYYSSVWYTCIITYSFTSGGTTPDTDTTHWLALPDISTVSPLELPNYYPLYDIWTAEGQSNPSQFLSGGSGSKRTYGYIGSGNNAGEEFQNWRATFNMSDQQLELRDPLTKGLKNSKTPKQSAFNTIFIGDMLDIEIVRCCVWDTLTGDTVFFKDYPVQTNYQEGVISWFNYFSLPYADTPDVEDRGSNLIISGLPYSSSYKLSLEFIYTTSNYDNTRTRAVGQIAFGLPTEIGTEDYGTSPNFQDYSIKSQNSFGEWDVVERKYNDTISYDLTIPLKDTSRVGKFLKNNRAYPMVFVATEEVNLENTIVYGYFKDYSTPLSDYSNSYASIEVESL